MVIFQIFSANTHCGSNQGKPNYDPGYPYSCKTWTNIFQPKSIANFTDLRKEYIFQSATEGFYTFQMADAAKQREQEERANKGRAFIAEFNRQLELRQLNIDRKIQDQPQVKSVGQKICRDEVITQRKIIGSSMGEIIYGTPVNLQAKITGFTEKLVGSKIQVRISGIQANKENLDRINGDVILEKGAIIWEEATNWGLCY